MRLYALNEAVAYLAVLRALGLSGVRILAMSPPFFGAVAKLLGISVELGDCGLDMGGEADVAHNFYETHRPKARVVFQGAGESVGEAEVFVKVASGCVAIETEEEELGERIALFLDGGVRRGRLWNFDLVEPGLLGRGEPRSLDLELLERQNETVRRFESAFGGNPYFDLPSVGSKTLKKGYPILLKPSLYCPKEEIFAALRERGVEVEVPLKPLYRTTLLAGESLPGSEELYKALLVLPLREEIIEPVLEVFERYRHRGCRF